MAFEILHVYKMELVMSMIGNLHLLKFKRAELDATLMKSN